VSCFPVTVLMRTNFIVVLDGFVTALVETWEVLNVPDWLIFVRFQKGFMAKAYHAIIWGQRPAYKSMKNIFQPNRRITIVRNSDKINHLPLKIFIFLQYQRSQLHIECSFCLIKSFFISQKCQFIWHIWFRNTPVPTRPTCLQRI
jgi:hypothetical protein